MEPEVKNKEYYDRITPQDALRLLKEGNERFVNNKMKERDWRASIKATSKEQYPFAVILSCMDSRTASEIIFDQGFGDIFNNRVAGNIVNEDILGSMEFACNVVGSKLVLVLGHTECGAIKGAIDNVEMGYLTGLLNKIDKAEEKADAEKFVKEKRSSDNSDWVQYVSEQNVRHVINEIREKSEILRGLEEKEKIMITGGIYNIATGVVSFFEG
jgi:carbonic anhydrase